MTIGERAAQAIRDRAAQTGRPARELIGELNISPRVLSAWENGHTEPRAHFLRQMALAGYDVIWILTGGPSDGS